jgi:hypothetical protein
MTGQREQTLSPLLNDAIFPDPHPSTTPTPERGSQVHGTYSDSGLARTLRNEPHGTHVATIDMLPDEIFLEIFALCIRAYGDPPLDFHMREWRRLVHVCQRWRQIIYGSPRYLDLILHCSNGTPVRKNLSCWPALPIGMCYHIPSRPSPNDEDEALALLKHSYRVCFIKMESSWNLQWGKVFAAMQEPFPVLRHFEFFGTLEALPLPSGFLGRSAPCLRVLSLRSISFHELPTLLLSARNLVSLKLTYIPPTGYISPEAMVTGLAALTMLKTLRITFFPLNPRPEERRRRPDPPMRVALLPALTDFLFSGCNEYLEVLVAQIDTPRLLYFKTCLARLDFLRLPQLSLFIDRSQNLGFRRVEVVFYSSDVGRNELDIELRVDRYLSGPTRPSLSLNTSFEWSGTHLTHVAHVLGQIFTLCSGGVDYLYIKAGEDHPAWNSNIDSAEWPAFFRLFTTVVTLHIVGALARQVARALEDVPEEMVTEVLPSLHLLILQVPNTEEPTSAQRFARLRQLRGSPVVIGDPHGERVEWL